MEPLTLAAIRFTDDLPAMQRYLETLGLATVQTWGPGMSVLNAGAGQVWLHSAADSDLSAPPGCTQLTGTVHEPEALAQQLKDAGFTATLIDEAYARTVETIDPTGATVTFNGDSDDYGSQAQPGAADPRLTVSLCRFTDPQGGYTAFVEALGLHREGEPNEWYVPYSAGRGTVGLHHDGGSPELPGADLGASVSFGLLTTGSLSELQSRLTAAGYDAGTVVTEEFGSRIETTDPDGQDLQIHQVADSPE